MRDFFISYNSADGAWAEWIAWQLEEAGYTTVIQAWDIRPGSNFVLRMLEGSVQAERTIAVLSDSYLGALFTQPEWTAAFAQDPTGEKGTLLPVRVSECSLEGVLRTIVHIDLAGLDETQARETLLQGVHRGRGKPAKDPGFPGTPPPTVPQEPHFPGTLPQIWNVPYDRNRNFTGREELLSGLWQRFKSGEPGAEIQAITGLGGVGKTQVALEYSYRRGASYTFVWWVRAEEPATLMADYGSLAEARGFGERGWRINVDLVRQWLQRNPGWLLVFDNARGPSEVLVYLPQGGAGHVLITSRNQMWRGVAGLHEIKGLARVESVAFLQKRTGETDEASASKLAEALGDLPLALEQAGAYMEATKKDPRSYLKLYQSHRERLLQQRDPSAKYPATVATTWELSFEELSRSSPPGAELINLCAFLAPDDIPRKLLSDSVQHLPGSLGDALADPLEFDQALAALRRYSFVEVDGDSLSIHRLVQAVARDRMPENTRRAWAEAAVRVVEDAFPFGSADPKAWSEHSWLLLHALAATAHAAELGVAATETADILGQMSLYLRGGASPTDAKILSERALAIVEAVQGLNPYVVAAFINNLGNVLEDLGELVGARAHYERALGIMESAKGQKHPVVATLLNNLGGVSKALGDLAKAREQFEQALAIAELVSGPDPAEAASIASNLGGVLRALGDYEGALALYQRALATAKAAYGSRHRNVASILRSLGDVLRDLGDEAGARMHLEFALKVLTDCMGRDHPDTLATQRDLDALRC
jgi:tetratricopeptide (TPR) repeat protein